MSDTTSPNLTLDRRKILGRQRYRWMSYGSPLWARNIYYRKSRSWAIKAWCCECAGSNIEAKRCEITDCPLWIFRPGAGTDAVPEDVPTPAEIEALAEEAGINRDNPGWIKAKE